MDQVIVSQNVTEAIVSVINSPVVVVADCTSVVVESSQNMRVELVSQESQIILAQGALVPGGGGSSNSYCPSGW